MRNATKGQQRISYYWVFFDAFNRLASYCSVCMSWNSRQTKKTGACENKNLTRRLLYELFLLQTFVSESSGQVIEGDLENLLSSAYCVTPLVSLEFCHHLECFN